MTNTDYCFIMCLINFFQIELNDDIDNIENEDDSYILSNNKNVLMNQTNLIFSPTIYTINRHYKN